MIFQVSFWYHLPFFRRTFLSNPFRSSLLTKDFLDFPNWRMSLFNLYSWMIFLLVIEVWIDSYFLSVLKTMWHFFGLHGFWWRNVEPFNHSSLIGNLLFSFGLLFSLVFSSLIMICLGVDFLKFILFEIYWASWTSLSPNLESV